MVMGISLLYYEQLRIEYRRLLVGWIGVSSIYGSGHAPLPQGFPVRYMVRGA
jgi:hypothetical protein